MKKNYNLIVIITLSVMISLVSPACVGSDDDGDGVLNSTDCAPLNSKIATDKTADKDCDGLVDGDDCEPEKFSSVRKTEDTDCDGILNGKDCDPKGSVDDFDCDGTPNNVDCEDQNPKIKTTKDSDTDCDGFVNENDCRPQRKDSFSKANDQDCDGVDNTNDCNPTDQSLKISREDDGDCDGFIGDQDCDDSRPDTNGKVDDRDCDMVLNQDDCDPENPAVATTPKSDKDCDGIPNAEDCDNKSPNEFPKTEDKDCDGIPDTNDCDPNGHVGDRDCDKIKDIDDCNPEDPTIATNKKDDLDCDGKPEIKLNAFSFVKKFKRMKKPKQQITQETFPGSVLKGKGKIFEFGQCRWMDKSKNHGKDCQKVILDKGMPRVVLYFDGSKSEEISGLVAGKTFSFDNCIAVDINDWGYWATATCDMPK